jgi:hypothetical protein
VDVFLPPGRSVRLWGAAFIRTHLLAQQQALPMCINSQHHDLLWTTRQGSPPRALRGVGRCRRWRRVGGLSSRGGLGLARHRRPQGAPLYNPYLVPLSYPYLTPLSNSSLTRRPQGPTATPLSPSHSYSHLYSGLPVPCHEQSPPPLLGVSPRAHGRAAAGPGRPRPLSLHRAGRRRHRLPLRRRRNRPMLPPACGAQTPVRHAVVRVFCDPDWDCLALTYLYCLVIRSPLANVDDGKSGPPPRTHFQGTWHASHV